MLVERSPMLGGRGPHGKSLKGMYVRNCFLNYLQNLQLERKCSVKVILLNVSCSRRQSGFVPELGARESEAKRSGKEENKETQKNRHTIRLIVK